MAGEREERVRAAGSRLPVRQPPAFATTGDTVSSKTSLTQARLKELVHYDPVTGVFTRIVGQWAGRRTGSPNVDGYLQVFIDGYNYYAHRLAFLWMEGRWPGGDVDHIDQNKSNNKWVNLREVSRSQNMHNTTVTRSNVSGVKGVSWHTAASKWRARITVDGDDIHLGLFNTIEEAVSARRVAATRVFSGIAKKVTDTH